MTTATTLPRWDVIHAWADRKSRDDLEHLWRIVRRDYSVTANTKYGEKKGDTLWPFIESCKGRSVSCLTICWAVEHNIPLTFKRGTDEWHVVMDEYDRIERKKSVAVMAERKQSPKPILAIAVSPVVNEDQDLPF